MRRLLVALLAAACVLPAHAQPRFGAVEESPRHAPPPGSQPTRPFAATPYRSAEDERCANFRRQLRAAHQEERNASTTTARDQAATHREQVFEQMQKAGC